MLISSRYFFNATSKSCEPFSYNGCSGSGNRFTTLSDCRDICETIAGSSSSSSSKASAAGGGSSAGLVAAEAVIGTAVVLLAIAAVVLGARYARTAAGSTGMMCPAWCGSYKRFFDVGGGGIGGILRRDRAGSTSSRRERDQCSTVKCQYRYVKKVEG